MTKVPKGKILIFDNNKILVDMMTVMMRDEGYTVKGSPFTANFMQIVQDYKPDLLLLDHQKNPPFNAYNLCFQLRVNAQTEHIPVIVLSVYGGQEVTNADQTAPDGLIVKPFSLNKLTGQLEQLLSLRKQLDGQ
jgi:CheY-like chemotaxis protein